MKENYTDITIILDASGSMHSLRDDVIGSINRFVEEQKKVPGTATLAIVPFNTWAPLPVPFDIRSFRLYTRYTYQPQGGTALLDALGQTINAVGVRLNAKAEAERPSKVIVAVITDGEENSSRLYSRDGVFAMIERQRTVYSWDVLFLAANQDAILAGAEYGIPMTASINYAATGAGYSAAIGAFSASVTRSRLTGDATTFDTTEAK